MSTLSDEIGGRLAALAAANGSRDASVRVWREIAAREHIERLLRSIRRRGRKAAGRRR